MERLLALGGPAHLSLIDVKDGALTFSVPEEDKPNETVRQSFVYRRVKLGVGSHPPIEFLIPVHLEGEPQHLAGWVFNRLCQALMGGHPMAGRVVLSLGFNVSDSAMMDRRTIRADVSAHAVLPHGIVVNRPIQSHSASFAIDHAELAMIQPERIGQMIRDGATRAMNEALRPMIDAAVDTVMRHEKEPPQR